MPRFLRGVLLGTFYSVEPNLFEKQKVHISFLAPIRKKTKGDWIEMVTPPVGLTIFKKRHIKVVFFNMAV